MTMTIELDPNHWTARLLNASLEKFAVDIRLMKPMAMRQSEDNVRGEVYRRMAIALEDAAGKLLEHRIGGS